MTDAEANEQAGSLPDDLISSTDAATLLHVATMTVRRWINEGQLPAYRIGKLYKVRKADVVAFIDASRLNHKTTP